MKLSVYSKQKGMCIAGGQIGVKINDIDVPHLADLQLTLQAKRLNKCTMTFFVDELEIDCDVEALIHAAEGDILEEGITKEDSGPDVTISHAALMKLLHDAQQKGFEDGKNVVVEGVSPTENDYGPFTKG